MGNTVDHSIFVFPWIFSVDTVPYRPEQPLEPGVRLGRPSRQRLADAGFRAVALQAALDLRDNGAERPDDN